MGAQEETYYNLKRLHAIFAVSAVLFLAATVWMILADHRRPWKEYQRTFRDRVEPWLTEAALRDEQSAVFQQQEAHLLDQLAQARRQLPDREAIEQFCRVLQDREGPSGASDAQAVRDAFAELQARPNAAARTGLLSRMQQCIRAAEEQLDKTDRQVRFTQARWDEARGRYELAAGSGASEAQLQSLQHGVDALAEELAGHQSRRQELIVYRERLQRVYDRITADEQRLADALAEHRAGVSRLARLLGQQRPSWVKWLLRLPVVDALGRQLQVEQIWLPELPIDYHFAQVGRFDRCTTCHAGIDKTAFGRVAEPAWPAKHELTIYLPAAAGTAASQQAAETLLAEYGFAFADRGVLNDRAVTVGLVIPGSSAAAAGLQPGDEILGIAGTGAADLHTITETLLGGAGEERVWTLRVGRGLAHPFAAHPRLDLYVGQSSPHPASRFGCTICHDGQGSATSFAWASHTPDDPDQRRRWQQRHDWFWNPHWEYPMRPGRFVESSCLKCHRDPLELESMDRFAEPAAPKLLAGYRLVQRYGCFGCHEIRGFDAAGQFTGPDLRLEPNYHEAAAALVANPQLAKAERQLALGVVFRPDDARTRHQLIALLQQRVPPTPQRGEQPEEGLLARQLRAALRVLAREEPTPGTLRKNGPSLRHVAEKLDAAFLHTYLANPQAFRPESRMPQTFGLHEHLDAESRRQTERFEAVEIRAIAAYLLGRSQPVLPEGKAPTRLANLPGSAKRGKQWFLLKGCAACHKHKDVPEAASTFGPDLSQLGQKLAGERGRRWLADWIRSPIQYSPRTLMPQNLVEPLPSAATKPQPASNQPNEDGSPIDPVADLVAFLLPPARPQPIKPVSVDEAALNQLVQMYLERQFPAHRAEQYAATGIPADAAVEIRGDAEELIGPASVEKKLWYVGRAAIRRRGCFGCHEIPGLEDAELVGPALTGWGRKQETLLAFEQVHQFVQRAERVDSDPPTARQVGPPPMAGQAGPPNSTEKAAATPAHAAHAHPSGNRPQANSAEDQRRRDFFREALLAHRREGFLWQKLSAPRSFDYQKAQNKGYLEWLVMGRFPLTEEQREAVATFLLGLTGERLPESYLPHPSATRRAQIEGRRVTEKYGCAECHLVRLPRWEVVYDPGKVEGPVPLDDFAFLEPRLDPARLDRENQPDRRGLLHAELVGMPEVDASGALFADSDDEDDPLYFFNLWYDVPMRVQDRWEVWKPGDAQMTVSDPFGVANAPPGVDAAQLAGPRLAAVRPALTAHLWSHQPGEGGALARLLLPHVADPAAATTTEAYSRVPPPLVREGLRVQPEWLFGYLLQPTPIRPAVVLRMPKCNLSPREAEILAAYYAAESGAEYPYHSKAIGQDQPSLPTTVAHPNRGDRTGAFQPDGGQGSLAPADVSPAASRLDAAFRLLTDRKTFCAKCHLIGDYSPGDEVQTTLAPRLDRAGERIRAEYLKQWIANPKRLLPYTGMPVNFPPGGPPVGQDLLPGSSPEQIDAVVHLLLHYGEYLQQRLSIRRLIEESEEQPPADPAR